MSVLGRIKKQSYKMATSSAKEEDSDGSDKVETRGGRLVHVVSPYDPPPSSNPEETNQDEVYSH